MKKLFFFIMLLSCAVYSQCPPTTVTLATQAQIDNFIIQYPNCTHVNNLQVVSPLGNSDITNLNGLQNITSVGTLRVSGWPIMSLAGLNSLTHVENDLLIVGTRVTSLAPLTNLTYVGRELRIDGNKVSSLAPLNNVTHFQDLFIQDAHFVNNVYTSYLPTFDLVLNVTTARIIEITTTHATHYNGLSSLTSITGYMAISGPTVTNLSGLHNLQSVAGRLSIDVSPAITSYSLSSLQHVGGNFGVGIAGTNLSFLSSLQSVGGGFSIGGPNLTSLNGLQNLTSVGRLYVKGNSLTDISALSNLTAISGVIEQNGHYPNYDTLLMGGIQISDTNLQTLNGLQNITNLTNGFLVIKNCQNLSDISAISNINPSTINRLLIRNSPNLAICSLPNLCSFLAGASYGGGAQEVWNELLTSPLSQDKYFIGGNAPGCNTYPEIMFNCGTVNNKISGTVKFHQQAGCQDSGTPAEGIEIISTDATGMQNITFTKPDGTYELYVPPGSYTTKAIVQSPFTATAPLTNTFTGTGAAFVAPFCISSSQTIQDVNVAIYPVQPARPGFDATYKIRIENTGTVAKSGTVSFQFDTAKQELVSFSTQPANYTDGNATWNFQLNPLSTRTITAILKVKAPPINNNGDTMTLTSALLPVGVDATPANNTYTLSQVLVGSYDPNDKAVLQGSQVLIGDADEYLTYKIRFQNTGTASAIFVKLQDQLDDKLDWSTFRPVSASHENYRLKIADGLLTVEFNNINLPPKSVDDAGSNGFFMYKIKPKNNVLLNDTIENTASIYFDYNAPIITNTVTTKYVEALSVARNELDDLAVYPNPANSKLNFMSAVTISSVEIYNNLGQKVHSNKGDNIIDADVSTLAEGIYICHIKTGDGKSAKRKIIISK